MLVLLIIVLVVATASLVVTTAFIVHELGWFPHTKDRSSPADRKFPFGSRFEHDALPTHGFQVLDPYTNVLRQYAHADVYDVRDPAQSLRTAIARYKEDATPSRYDDVIHLSNHICNHVRCDDQVNSLIAEIHELIHSHPPKVARRGE